MRECGVAGEVRGPREALAGRWSLAGGVFECGMRRASAGARAHTRREPALGPTTSCK